VIAALSNGGGYANLFRDREPVVGPGLLESVLDELWDFDTRISSDGAGNPAPQDFLQEKGKPLRGYYQTAGNVNPAAFFKAVLPDARWKNYYDKSSGGTTPPSEIPPLPPGPYNDTLAKDAPHTLEYRHHLIREFMFLDAVAHNNTGTAHSVPQALRAEQNRFLVVRKNGFVFSSPAERTQVSKFTQGPGRHPVDKLLLDDSTFVEQGASLLDFETKTNVSFTALLYELQERATPGVAANVVPNWFGVAIPDSITDFRNVILYFHPNPTQVGAGYNPSQYQSKSGPPGTNWKELFAYVDRLGNQLAGAATSQQRANQIVMFPFMKQFRDVGILPEFWYHIVIDILDDIQTNGV
jgi:hypothetical protein